MHPIGKSPVITDDKNTDDKKTVAESGAIIEYILINFLERIHAREAYQKALKKGVSYNLFS